MPRDPFFSRPDFLGHFWNDLTKSEKLVKFSSFLKDFGKIDHLLDYFDEFNDVLSKKTLNSYLKSVSNP